MSDKIKGKLNSFDNYLKNLSDINIIRENFFSSFNYQTSLNRKTKRSKIFLK